MYAQAIISHGRAIRAVAAALTGVNGVNNATLNVAFEQLDAMYDIRNKKQ